MRKNDEMSSKLNSKNKSSNRPATGGLASKKNNKATLSMTQINEYPGAKSKLTN